MSLKKNNVPDASVAEDLTASQPEGDTKPCTNCNGVGVNVPVDPTVLCPECQGSGTIKA